MSLLASIITAVIVNVIAYLLVPKPSIDAGQAQGLREPQASAGLPIPVVFGEVMITSPNVLYYGDVSTKKRKVKM